MKLKFPVQSARRGTLLAFALFLCGVPAWAQLKVKLAVAPSEKPPLLDREIFFGNPEIGGAQISPDGKYIAFLKPHKDTRNVWVKGRNESFAQARLITAETKRPVAGYFWSRDGKYILFVKDNGGDENFNIYAVNPAETPAAGQETPAARNLTAAKNVRAQIYATPKSDADAIYIGLNDRDPAWHDLYKVKISTGEKTLIRQNTDRIAGWLFDNKDQLRLAARSNDNGETDILRVEADGKFTKIYNCSVFESCNPLRFDKANAKIYLDTNKGNRDLSELVLLDPSNGSETPVEGDPLKRVDFGGASFSDKTDELLATTYEDDRTRIYFKNKAFEKDYKQIKKMLGEREISVGSGTADETLWIVSSYSDTDPGTVWLFDRKSKNLSTLYQVREKLPREAMATMTPIRYKSSDGLEIPAYLTLPKGVPAKNLPLIVNPHGGPWGRDTWGFDAYAQFLANRGYAVLQPNFRASTGYGKKFLNAGNNQWGELMQDDITWGVKHLVNNGTVDPKRVGIMGGSYGGYAALAGVTFTPDLYAASVAIVAPSNLITLLESIPPYWDSIRTVFYERMGNPNTPAGKAQMTRQSPLTHAAKIKTPLLVAQGANDPRVNKRESDQIVVALRDRGFPVQYIVAPDEGHGFQRPVNNMALIAAAERFLAQYLGGRFQESATPEVTQRLKEITVDPKTVTLAKKMDATSAVAAPKPTHDLTPGKAKYNGNIALGGQSIPLPITQEIKEENGAWVVTEIATTPQGEIFDQTTLEKGALTLKQRNIKQGPVAINFMVANNRASGMMGMAGPAKPFDADLGGPLFADGAGTYAVIAQLPLTEGYTTTFRNFDLQKQKVDMKQLKVLGREKVTVPAGAFDAYKVEITGDDGTSTTVWIDPATRRYVKLSAVLASMGGATLTVELAQ
jgi:dipeptidyl aminopeptidase/acylaminoacyl peptidase